MVKTNVGFCPVRIDDGFLMFPLASADRGNERLVKHCREQVGCGCKLVIEGAEFG